MAMHHGGPVASPSRPSHNVAVTPGVTPTKKLFQEEETAAELKNALAKRREVVDDKGDHFVSSRGQTNTSKGQNQERASWDSQPPSLPTPPCPKEARSSVSSLSSTPGKEGRHSWDSQPASWPSPPVQDSVEKRRPSGGTASSPRSSVSSTMHDTGASPSDEAVGAEDTSSAPGLACRTPPRNVDPLDGLSEFELKQVIHQLMATRGFPPVDQQPPPGRGRLLDDGDEIGAARGKSLPPKCVAYHDSVPEYPDLRKKRRSLGDRPAPQLEVRFADTPTSRSTEEGELGSDNEDAVVPVRPGNIALRHRRMSRGPDGRTYRVNRENSPDKASEQPQEGPSILGGIKGAAVGAATGAAWGVLPGLFTFGLAIPAGAAIGAYNGYRGASTGAEGTTDSTSSDRP